MLRLCDLPNPARAALLSRVAALGLNPTLWSGESEPPNSYHGEGVGWRNGTFFYRKNAEVHGLAHEVGHLAQLSTGSWLVLDEAELGAPPYRGLNSEDLALLIQVELARDIPGLGVDRMLREMEEVGYSLAGLSKGSAVSASYWWRHVVPQAMADDLQEARSIGARWQSPATPLRGEVAP